jgi:hypothetical protein
LMNKAVNTLIHENVIGRSASAPVPYFLFRA